MGGLQIGFIQSMSYSKIMSFPKHTQIVDGLSIKSKVMNVSKPNEDEEELYDVGVGHGVEATQECVTVLLFFSSFFRMTFRYGYGCVCIVCIA